MFYALWGTDSDEQDSRSGYGKVRTHRDRCIRCGGRGRIQRGSYRCSESEDKKSCRYRSFEITEWESAFIGDSGLDGKRGEDVFWNYEGEAVQGRAPEHRQ